jgi:hypothetical protein
MLKGSLHIGQRLTALRVSFDGFRDIFIKLEYHREKKIKETRNTLVFWGNVKET